MPQSSRRKYSRSDPLAKPESCPPGFSRTSTSRLAPESRSSEKNALAGFLVKPMV